MEPERWRRITDLFEAVCELPELERAKQLAQAPADERAEVESLLAHALGDTLDDVQQAVAAVARDLVPDADPSAWIGRRLGRYVVLDRLGVGGMGVVYAAWDPELDRKVAIKLLHSHPGATQGGESPLIGEARALARLAHPNVLAIHDVGTFGDQVFVATEFVDGLTLRRWLRKRRPWREILAVLVAAGEGLAAAHAVGLVHRDFKPENVMVARDGRVRVMDFGLARTGREPAPGEPPALTTTLRSAVVGTPAYMAPEQWEGGALDARTDVFAFCVTAWESFHGERPFGGDLQTATVEVAMASRPPAAPVRSKLPTWIQRILLRGLRADPRERYPDMNALLAELRNDPWARLGRLARVAGAVAAVAAVAYVAVDVTRPGMVSVRVTGDGAVLADAAVQVGPHALAVADGEARGEVPAGTYRLSASAPEHVAREAVVEVERGREVHLDLELRHEQGRLDLMVDPPGSTILVDGVDQGARLRGLLVDTGEHLLRARHPGYYDVDLRWSVGAEETRSGYTSLSRGLVWSRRETGALRRDVVMGDVDGDGRPDLLHRNFGELSVVSPWDERTLWTAPTRSTHGMEHFTGDLDGDEFVDLMYVEFFLDGTTEMSVWAGADVRGPKPRPRWTRNGRTSADPWRAPGYVKLVDVDGDGAQDVVAAVLREGVAAYSGRTGELLWHADVGQEVRELVVADAGSRLFVATHGHRHAIDVRRGTLQWSRQVAGQTFLLAQALPGAPDVLVSTDVDAAAQRVDVQAHEGRDGALRWRHELDDPRDRSLISVTPGRDAAGSRVVIAASEVIGLDGDTGAERWRIPRAATVSLFAHAPDDPEWLVTLAVDPGLAVHRLADGAHLHDVDLGGAAVSAPVRHDWDADGEYEMAVPGRDAVVMVARGGAREGSLYLPDVSPTDAFSIGDLDRDGFADLTVNGMAGTSLVLGPKVLWSRRSQFALRSSPVVADLDADGRLEIAVVGIFDGVRGLHAFDAASGAPRWPGAEIPHPDIIRAPVLLARDDGGHDLVTRTASALHRHDGRSGALVASWGNAPLGYASAGVGDVERDGALELFVTPWDAGALAVLDAATLTTRWTHPIPVGSWSPPVLARDGDATLLVLHLLDGGLHVLDADARAPRWSRPLGEAAFSAPTVADLDGDGVLELVASQAGAPGDLVCMRLSDGVELWRRAGLGGRASPVVAHDVDGDGMLELLHTSNGGGMLAFDRHGVIVWQYTPRPGLATQPNSDGGGLVTDLDGDGGPEYVTSLRDGVMYVLDARTGAFRWQFRAGGERLEAPPVAADVDGDGRKEVILGGHDQVLYVLRTPAVVR